MSKNVIEYCYIEEGARRNIIWARFSNGIMKQIGAYYPDEMTVDRTVFMGLTEEEADKVLREMDKAYLQS